MHGVKVCTNNSEKAQNFIYRYHQWRKRSHNMHGSQMYMYVVLYEFYGRGVFLTSGCQKQHQLWLLIAKNFIKPHVHLWSCLNKRMTTQNPLVKWGSLSTLWLVYPSEMRSHETMKTKAMNINIASATHWCSPNS